MAFGPNELLMGDQNRKYTVSIPDPKLLSTMVAPSMELIADRVRNPRARQSAYYLLRFQVEGNLAESSWESQIKIRNDGKMPNMNVFVLKYINTLLSVVQQGFLTIQGEIISHKGQFEFALHLPLFSRLLKYQLALCGILRKAFELCLAVKEFYEFSKAKYPQDELFAIKAIEDCKNLLAELLKIFSVHTLMSDRKLFYI